MLSGPVTGVIILLGAPNDEHGNLSSIALERCARAVLESRASPGWAVLPTGGHGEHFNRAPEPPASYTRRYLRAQGVPEEDVLEPVLSRSTLEDAQRSLPVVARLGVRRVKVVTSDVHVVRAALIFERVFAGYQLAFCGSETLLPRAELALLRAHEEGALTDLKRQQGLLS